MPETRALQEHCIYCGREQYAPAVLDISEGKHPCVWCGRIPPVLTEQEYREAHVRRREQEGRRG